MEQEIHDVAQVLGPVGGEGMLHEAGGEKEFARRTGRRVGGESFRGTRREDEMGEPGVLFRGQAQARFWRPGKRAADQHAVDPVALGVGEYAIAGESQEHGEDNKALASIVQCGDAGLRSARRDHAEIEAFFRDIFLVDRISGGRFDVDKKLRHLGRLPVESS